MNEIEQMMRVTENVKQSLKNKYNSKGLSRITGHGRKPSGTSVSSNTAPRNKGIVPYSNSRMTKAGGFAERRCTELLVDESFSIS